MVRLKFAGVGVSVAGPLLAKLQAPPSLAASNVKLVKLVVVLGKFVLFYYFLNSNSSEKHLN